MEHSLNLRKSIIMIEIIPAIIPTSYEDLENKLSLVRGVVKTVQIDISDGKFSPNITFPFNYGDAGIFEKIKTEEEGLPFWKDFDFEVHLMTENPEKYALEWQSAGAFRLVVHAERLKDFESLRKDIAELTEIVVALNLDTDLEKIKPILHEISSVQLMSISKIGFQGEFFDERVLERICTLRRERPDLIISVDGGITLDNASQLIHAGANRLVVGSAIFGSDNILETIEEFKNLV